MTFSPLINILLKNMKSILKLEIQLFLRL